MGISPKDLIQNIKTTDGCELVDNSIVSARLGDPPSYGIAGMKPACPEYDVLMGYTPLEGEAPPHSPIAQTLITSLPEAAVLPAMKFDDAAAGPSPDTIKVTDLTKGPGQ